MYYNTYYENLEFSVKILNFTGVPRCLQIWGTTLWQRSGIPTAREALTGGVALSRSQRTQQLHKRDLFHKKKVTFKTSVEEKWPTSTVFAGLKESNDHILDIYTKRRKWILKPVLKNSDTKISNRSECLFVQPHKYIVSDGGKETHRERDDFWLLATLRLWHKWSVEEFPIKRWSASTTNTSLYSSLPLPSIFSGWMWVFKCSVKSQKNRIICQKWWNNILCVYKSGSWHKRIKVQSPFYQVGLYLELQKFKNRPPGNLVQNNNKRSKIKITTTF